MPWSKKQKQIAGMACGQAGVDNDARKLILRQFRNAFFNVQGMPVSDPTSTSSKLENKDFERFMAILEDRAGGRILHFTPNYFQEKAGTRSDSVNERMAWKIRELYRTYESQKAGGLEGHGIYGLDGLVSRFSSHRTRELDELTPKEAWNLIEMLKALVDRRGEPAKPTPVERQQRMFSDQESPALTTIDPPLKRRVRGKQPELKAIDIPF